MKLSFSIDVILGNNKKEDEKSNSDKSNYKTCNNKRKRDIDEIMEYNSSPHTKSLKLSPNVCVRKRSSCSPHRELVPRFHPLNLLPYSLKKIEEYHVKHHPDYYPFHPPYLRHDSENSAASLGVKPSLYTPKSRTNGSPQHRKSTSEDEEVDVETLRSPVVNVDKSSSDESSPNSCEEKKKKGRIGRRLFSGLQILELEKVFGEKPYINRMERAVLALQVRLTEGQIKTWFQNRRTKEKRRGEGSEGEDTKLKITDKAVRVPGYGIQVKPICGPPDQHLRAAMNNYFKKKQAGLLLAE